MASIHDIEALRVMALEEQYNAAYEDRMPDRHMLDGLAKMVLPDFAPVICDTPVAYALTFNDREGYVSEVVQEPGTIAGCFGGFFSGTVEVDFEEDGVVPLQRVGYFIMDTSYHDTGYICPVDAAELWEVETLLQRDFIYNELAHAIAQEYIDMAELVAIVNLITEHNPNIEAYNAFLRTTLQPEDVYKRVVADRYYMINIGESLQDDMPAGLSMDIGRGDVFEIVCTGINPPELAILKANDATLIVPVSAVVGCVPGVHLQMPRPPYDVRLAE